jgi:hypothetical protein
MKFISFNILMQLLRDRNLFLNEIDECKQLDLKIFSLLFYSSLFFALYGAILGSIHGWLQMLSSAFKLPALYLITLLICLPTLYFLDIIFGSKKTFSQYVTLLLASMSLISIMLFGFAPISLFFRLSINDYDFFLLLNVVILAITGVIGVKFFYEAMLSLIPNDDTTAESAKNRRKLIKFWLILYGFVGSQLGWTLRPFFGTPDQPFSLYREIESNFYIQVMRIIGNVFGLN